MLTKNLLRFVWITLKRHHDHDVDSEGKPMVCLWCGKPWPCADFADAERTIAQDIADNSNRNSS